MARTPHTPVGVVVVLAVAVLVGAPLAAGTALAQESTDDGMAGNETTSDGDTMENETETMNDGGTMDDGTETMDDEQMTEDGMGDEQMTDEETMGDEQMTDEETMDDETASDGQPGFGVAVVVAALAAVTGISIYRRRG